MNRPGRARMTTVPLVSAIIPTYNRARLVERAIQSILGQTFQDFELIVVDDGSEDETAEILSRYDRWIKVVSQANRGVSAARNAGISKANGTLLAFLDSDDEWSQEKLQRQVDVARTRGPLFICHTDERWMRGGKELPQRDIHRKQGGRFFERALERCLISPSAVMLSRALLDEVGWFDEQLPAAEDYDLWLRVTAFHPVDFIPAPLVIKHGGHPDQLSITTSAIDRYRIVAICKMIAHPNLSEHYRIAARNELARKCRIVANGCSKRGNEQEAQAYLELARMHENTSS